MQVSVASGASGVRSMEAALLAAPAGVGAVISSSASAALTAASLASLAAGGALVELGKRGVWSTHAVAAERRDVSYSLVSLDLLATAAGGRMMTALACALARGALVPPACAAYALGRARQAMAFLAQAGRVGQVVLSQRALTPCSRSRYTVVTGGLGALGSLVALWLVQQGAGRTVLLGRSGRASGARGRLWQLLLAGSGAVVAGRCDLTACEDRAAQRQAGGQSGPCGATVHAGGEALDAQLERQGLTRLRRVLGPKLAGLCSSTWASDGAPVVSDLQFSSVAALLGGGGQANYSAANAALDASADALRARGLASSSMQWGPWAGAGMAVANSATLKRSAAVGLETLSMPVGLSALSGVLRYAASGLSGRDGSLAATVAVAPFDWSRMSAALGGHAPSWLREFMPAACEENAVSSACEQPAKARRQTAASVRSIVETAIRQVLGPGIDYDEPLADAGVDSMSAIELYGAIAAAVDVQLPSTLFYDYPSVNAVIAFVAAEHGAAGGVAVEQQAAGAGTVSHSLIVDIEALLAPSSPHAVTLRRQYFLALRRLACAATLRDESVLSVFDPSRDVYEICSAVLLPGALIEIAAALFCKQTNAVSCIKHMALLASAVYADAALLSFVLMQVAGSSEQLVDARYFRTAAGLCGLVTILRDEHGLALYVVFRGQQGKSHGVVPSLPELVGSFFDEWRATLAKLAGERVRVVLVGHSLGAAVASCVYAQLRERFARWTFCLYTFGSIPFATLPELHALESECDSLLAWVSVANEGQDGSCFRDLFVFRNDMVDAAGSPLYSWNSCRGAYGEPDRAVQFDSADDVAGEQLLQATPATRIYIVDSSRHISASMYAFLNQSADACNSESDPDEAGAVAHRNMVKWAAHCAFTCAPGTMVVL
jgi:acyl carrier protein/pimeloyl-ACP methyl ester carboxylesterase